MVAEINAGRLSISKARVRIDERARARRQQEERESLERERMEELEEQDRLEREELPEESLTQEERLAKEQARRVDWVDAETAEQERRLSWDEYGVGVRVDEENIEIGFIDGEGFNRKLTIYTCSSAAAVSDFACYIVEVDLR